MRGPSDFDRENMEAIIAGHGTWFSAHLLRLIARADSENIARLRLGFPDHVQAYIDWVNSPRVPERSGGRAT